jgi:hypothetical protein
VQVCIGVHAHFVDIGLLSDMLHYEMCDCRVCRIKLVSVYSTTQGRCTMYRMSVDVNFSGDISDGEVLPCVAETMIRVGCGLNSGQGCIGLPA